MWCLRDPFEPLLCVEEGRIVANDAFEVVARLVKVFDALIGAGELIVDVDPEVLWEVFAVQGALEEADPARYFVELLQRNTGEVVGGRLTGDGFFDPVS